MQTIQKTNLLAQMKSNALTVALTFLTIASHAALNVPGTANPWLAGMPTGSGACGGDSAPGQSPVLFQSFTPGSILTFSVAGSTDHGGPPIGLSPDGGPVQPHPAENGIASNNVPISALLGVFLDSSPPDGTPAPSQFPYAPVASILKPGLKQVFFIGDGLTGTGAGARQQVVAPAGATRLFLGTQDGCSWSDNGGSFTVSITVYSPSFTVPGTANPWLAGMPNGSTACGGDSAPAQSAVLTQPVLPGTVLTFDVSGSTDHAGSPDGLSPDGGPPQPHAAENGIASNNIPISALVGVFLDASAPNTTQPPAAFPYVPDALVSRPGLKQPFFIGDGRGGAAITQQFIVPTGASRLFLGTQDGCRWLDNGGSFEVSVNPSQYLDVVASIRFSQVEICWESLPDSIYQIQYSSNALSTSWMDLGAPVSGNGALMCITDQIPVGQDQRLYRVLNVP